MSSNILISVKTNTYRLLLVSESNRCRCDLSNRLVYLVPFRTSNLLKGGNMFLPTNMGGWPSEILIMNKLRIKQL